MVLQGILTLSLLTCQMGQPTIGVLDFTVNRNSAEHSADTSSYRWGPGDSKALTKDFTTVLSKTRKFNILERDRVLALYDELEYKKDSPYVSLKQFKKEALKHASFILAGEIERFKIKSQTKPVPYSKNRTKQVNEVTLITRVELINQADGSKVFMDKATISQESSSLDMATIIEKARLETAELLVGKIVDELYPVVVIRVKGKNLLLTISRSPSFKEGNTYIVYSIDDDILIDPQTGEELGYMEEYAGKIKLTDILPKFAKAVLLEDGEGIKAGDICRPDN